MATAHPVRVEVATPGSAVLLDAGVVEETVAAVRACLDNVLAHAGPDASAWVLAAGRPRRGHHLGPRRRSRHRAGPYRECGLGGSSRRRLLDPGTHRGPRRHPPASTAATGAPSGSSRCRSGPRDHPHQPPVPRARGRPRSRTTSPRAPRRVGVPLDRRHARRSGGPHRLVVAGRRRRAGTRAGAAGPRCRPDRRAARHRPGRRTAAAVGGPRPGRRVRGRRAGARRGVAAGRVGSTPTTVRGWPARSPGPLSASSPTSRWAGPGWSPARSTRSWWATTSVHSRTGAVAMSVAEQLRSPTGGHGEGDGGRRPPDVA